MDRLEEVKDIVSRVDLRNGNNLRTILNGLLEIIEDQEHGISDLQEKMGFQEEFAQNARFLIQRMPLKDRIAHEIDARMLRLGQRLRGMRHAEE